MTSIVVKAVTVDPPIVVPSGRFIAVPVAVIVASPNSMLDPLRYRSLQR